MDVLLLGCGKSRERKIRDSGQQFGFDGDNLTTVDMDPTSTPNVLMDIEDIASGGKFPFPDCSFDEIHAYNVLEHIGKQGDWRGYFTEFGEYHRILKEGGRFFILVPIGGDAIADPGHTRFFTVNHIGFLAQEFYDQIEQGYPATDYRWFWKKDFKIELLQKIGNHHIAAVIRKA